MPDVGGVEADLPRGILTFCLTDIEGSTALWNREREAMSVALTQHDELIAAIVVEHDGTLMRAQGEGDSTLSVFVRPVDAVRAAVAVHDALRAVRPPRRRRSASGSDCTRARRRSGTGTTSVLR